MKVSAILRDYLWKLEGENTMVSYTFNNEQPKPFAKENACFGKEFVGMETIDGKYFLECNNIFLTPKFEIY
jgi:hypothetical protein